MVVARLGIGEELVRQLQPSASLNQAEFEGDAWPKWNSMSTPPTEALFPGLGDILFNTERGIFMATTRRRSHKHFQLDSVKIKRAQKSFVSENRD